MRRYDVSHGLAGDKVWDLELDATGALWAATPTGASRFDGVGFRNFDARHGLPHGNVLRLLRLADGRLAAGTGTGVALLDPRTAADEKPWKALPVEGETNPAQIIELVADPAGGVWAGGVQGLFRLEGALATERLVALPLPEGEKSVRLLASDGAGGLWVGFEATLRRRAADGAWSVPFELPEALDDPAGLTAVLAENDTTHWLASRRSLCALFGGGVPDDAGRAEVRDVPVVTLAEAGAFRASRRTFCVDVERGLPPTRTRRLIEAAARGRLLVTGSGGLVEIGGDRLFVRVASADLGDADLLSSYEGETGDLWFGTGDRGLLHLLTSGVEVVAPADELGGSFSSLLLRGEEIAVVVDHLDVSRRLLRLHDGRIDDVTPPGAGAIRASWGWGAASLLGPDSAWWVGTSGGVTRFPRRPHGRFGPAQKPFPELQRALEGHEPMRLFYAADGALWVSSHEPVDLHRLTPASGTVRRFEEIGGFPGGAVSALAEDDDGTIWAGFFRGGLARQRAEGPFEWLESAEEMSRGFVYALRFDHLGQLWVGTGRGLRVCRAPRAADPGCEHARPGSDVDQIQVFAVAEDPQGRIAAATAKGLHLLDPASDHVDVLTTAEGLPSNNVADVEPAADGSFWLATASGIARLTPAPRSHEPAPLRIIALEVAGRARSLPLAGVESIERLELAPGERTLLIEVASIDLGSGGLPAYQWRLGDGTWSAPSNDRRLRLAGLAEGEISIEARAISADGRAGRDVARLLVEVSPPFWRRGWFLVLVAAAVAAAATIGYRVRVARLLALERVRTRIAGDLHDDLGSSLSRISILAEVARRQSAGSRDAPAVIDTLDTIGASARELAEMASDIVWAIDPQRDDLASWVSRLRRFGDDLFSPAGVRFEVVAPADAAAIRLAAAARRDLFLLAKEALNNAAKYAGARAVRVEVVRHGGRLEVAIEDDGRGFTAESRAEAERRGGGRGLRTMEERAGRLGGAFEIAARADGGTRVALAFPL